MKHILIILSLFLTGCDGCKWEDYDMPCLECTRCYQDKFEPKK